MAKEVLFDQKYNAKIIENIEIFKYEYPEIAEQTWNEFRDKPNCSCRGKIFKIFQDNIDKFNGIMSKLLGEEVIVNFPGPLTETIVKEFDTLKEMEAFLNELRVKSKMMRSASPSPNGKGGFVLICM